MSANFLNILEELNIFLDHICKQDEFNNEEIKTLLKEEHFIQTTFAELIDLLNAEKANTNEEGAIDETTTNASLEKVKILTQSLKNRYDTVNQCRINKIAKFNYQQRKRLLEVESIIANLNLFTMNRNLKIQ